MVTHSFGSRWIAFCLADPIELRFGSSLGWISAGLMTGCGGCMYAYADCGRLAFGCPNTDSYMFNHPPVKIPTRTRGRLRSYQRRWIKLIFRIVCLSLRCIHFCTVLKSNFHEKLKHLKDSSINGILLSRSSHYFEFSMFFSIFLLTRFNIFNWYFYMG